MSLHVHRAIPVDLLDNMIIAPIFYTPQACSAGCVDIQRRIAEIEKCRSTLTLALEDVPMQIIGGLITPNGADTQICQ